MKLTIACIQLTSNDDIAANIARVEQLVAEAAGKGAEFVATPENVFLMAAANDPHPKREREKWTQAEHPGVVAAAKMAKRHGVWLLVGSVAVDGGQMTDDGKTYNRSILFNPQGEIAATYDKIHLFDVEVGDGQSYRESTKMLAGEKVVLGNLCLVQSEKKLLSTKLGLTICYDLRFPQLYRALAKAGAEIIAVPSAFTQVTGEAHWHVLLRARAIENGCFIIAPAQTGMHPGGRKTYGHSLVVDPWGKILADGGTEEGVVMAEIDLDEVKKIRAKIPSLGHDTMFQ
jgi:predicted amidohydrolase